MDRILLGFLAGALLFCGACRSTVGPNGLLPPKSSGETATTELQLIQKTAETHGWESPVRPVSFSAASSQSESSQSPRRPENVPPAGLFLADRAEMPWDEDAESFDRLTLDRAVALAIDNNPSLAQAAASIRRVQSQRAQVGYYPNPTLGYQGSNIGDDSTAGEHGASLSQVWVTADKLRWNRAVAAGDVAAAEAILATQQRRVAAGVTAYFYLALAAQKQVEAARRLQEVADAGLEATERRYELERTTRGDLLQAEVVLDRAALGTGRAGIAALAAWRQLASAIGMPDLEPMRLVGELGPPEDLEDLDKINIEVLWERLRSESPQLRTAAALVARTEARLARERAEAVPNIEFQGQLQHDFANDQALGGLSVGVPLPLRHRNQGAIAAAAAEHQRAVANYRRVELQLRQRLAEVVGEAETAGTRIESYRNEIVPKAEESLELIQEQYENDETDLLRLLTAQESYAAALVDLIIFQTDWRIAWTAIDGLLLDQPLEEPEQPPTPGYGAGFTGVSRAQ